MPKNNEYKSLIFVIINKLQQTMDNRIIPFISRYLPVLDQLLNCSKKFTLGRWYNLRCKNKVYFRDGAVKMINCNHPVYTWIKCKDIWYKEGKVHRDDIDPSTGLTLPTVIYADGRQYWYKEGYFIDMM